MLNLISAFMIRLFFYQAPKFIFTNDEIEEYEQIYHDSITQNGIIEYRSSYPKSRFLSYISSTKDVVLHGSNNKNIDEFEPRRQTLFNGELVEAVFATKDGIWPVFYAILDKAKVVSNFRNGSISAGTSKNRFHFYSLDHETVKGNPWISGMIYFLPAKTFTNSSRGAVVFDEWVSEVPVKPICKIEVEPNDFYFIDKVATHNAKESIIRTWLLYKLRSKLWK